MACSLLPSTHVQVPWKDISPKHDLSNCLLCDHALQLLWFVCLPQKPEDQLGTCQGPRGRITHYQIRFQVGSAVLTDVNVNISACTTERCSNTFNLSNVPSGRIPSSYDSVSVAAINAVGMGAARMCTSQSISKWNLLHTTFEEYIYIHIQEFLPNIL